MGLLDWFLNLFRPTPGETPADVADRLDRFADRARNAGDLATEEAARLTAEDARRAPTTDAAVAIEHAFLRARGLGPDGRPPRPVRGQLATGAPYVRYGDRARSGGSLSWRYHNPGYVRCSPRSSGYGAIGCDGEYAIFPDERTGTRALLETLRTEYPDRPLGDALREHLPPEANPAGVTDQLIQQGFDIGASVNSFAEGQLEAAADACRACGGWESGSVLDSDTGGAAWDEVAAPSAGTETGPEESGDGAEAPTDNS